MQVYLMSVEQKREIFLKGVYGMANQMNEDLAKTDCVNPQGCYFPGHHLIFLEASKMKSIKHQ